MVLVPEESLHPRRHLYLASIVVYGCIRQCRAERDTAVCGSAADALPQLAGVYQYGTARTYGAASALPCLVEECLPFKVAVKLITQLHPNVV